ncbi:MAG TPA: hypothetical protein VNI02_06245 [Blastocatellia bacterium]|nr:hypothetical protein [Blastocatellia bacterium]
MKLRRVEVECYAGGRADERPRLVREGGREHIVVRLLGSEVEESLNSKARSYRYRVLTDEGLALSLIRQSDGDWYLERRARGDKP